MVGSIFAKAEICEKGYTIFIILDILWLDGTMSDSKFVTVHQRFKDLSYDYAGFAFSVWLTLLNASITVIKELTTDTKLHHLIQFLIILISLKVLANAWVVHLSECFYFV